MYKIDDIVYVVENIKFNENYDILFYKNQKLIIDNIITNEYNEQFLRFKNTLYKRHIHNRYFKDLKTYRKQKQKLIL